MNAVLIAVPLAALAVGIVNILWLRRLRRAAEARGRLALMSVAVMAPEPPEDAVAMLARWHAEGQAERDEAWTAAIEKILSEADNG